MQVIVTILVVMYGLFGVSSFFQSLTFDSFITAFVQLVVFLFNFNVWWPLDEEGSYFQVGVFLDLLKLIFWLQITLMTIEKLRLFIKTQNLKIRHTRLQERINERN